jgi:DNA primase
VPVLPAEAHAPLVIDADAMLPRAVAPQLLQAIVGRDAEVIRLLRGIKHDKLLEHCAVEVAWKTTQALSREETLGVAVREALNHPTP